MQEYLPYAGIIIVVLMFIMQNKLFVTPEQLEKKHIEILENMRKQLHECDCKFASKRSLDDISEKIDKIYSILIERNK